MDPTRDLNYRVTPYQVNYQRPGQYHSQSGVTGPPGNYYPYPMHHQQQQQPSFNPQPNPQGPIQQQLFSPHNSQQLPQNHLQQQQHQQQSQIYQPNLNFHGSPVNYHQEVSQSYPYHGRGGNYSIRPTVPQPLPYSYPHHQQPTPHSLTHPGIYPSFDLNSNRQQQGYHNNLVPMVQNNNPSYSGNAYEHRPQPHEQKPFTPQQQTLPPVSHHHHPHPHPHHQQQQQPQQQQPLQVKPNLLIDQTRQPPLPQQHLQHQQHFHQHMHHQLIRPQPSNTIKNDISQNVPRTDSANAPFSSCNTANAPVAFSTQITNKPYVPHPKMPPAEVPSSQPGPLPSQPTESTIKPNVASTTSTSTSTTSVSQSKIVTSETKAPTQSPTKATTTTTSTTSSTTNTTTPAVAKQQVSIPSHDEQMDVDFIRRMMMPSDKHRSSSSMIISSPSKASSPSVKEEKEKDKGNEKVDSPSKSNEATSKGASSTSGNNKGRQRKNSASTVEKLRKSFTTSCSSSKGGDVKKTNVNSSSRSMKGNPGRRRKMASDLELDSSFTTDDTSELTTLDSLETVVEVEPYNPPTKLNPLINRTLPPISEEHRKLINNLKDAKIIEDDTLYKLMLSLDMKLFYENISPEWAEHEAVCLERTIKHIKPGCSVLVFPYNTYFSVALGLYVGTGGRVVAFGHQGNAFALRSNGLSWLLDDYRIRFTNNTAALYYGHPDYNTYLECGFPKGAPYDLVVLTDQELTNEIRSQCKVGGLFIRPDEEDLFFTNEPIESNDDPYNTETETEAESETETEDNS